MPRLDLWCSTLVDYIENNLSCSCYSIKQVQLNGVFKSCRRHDLTLTSCIREIEGPAQNLKLGLGKSHIDKSFIYHTGSKKNRLLYISYWQYNCSKDYILPRCKVWNSEVWTTIYFSRNMSSFWQSLIQNLQLVLCKQPSLKRHLRREGLLLMLLSRTIFGNFISA